MEKLTREKIKEIVYNCAKERFYDDEYFNEQIMTKSYDGENELIYDEIMFDSLDMIEFIMETEQTIGNELHHKFIIPDEIIDNDITLGKIIDYIYNNQ